MTEPTLLESYAVLARYNRWMNERLYATAALLTGEERRRDLRAFFKSVHATLNHILWADRTWLGRLSGDPTLGESRDARGELINVGRTNTELYDDFDQLRAERAKSDAAILSWIGSLDEAALRKVVSYTVSSGASFTHPLWWALQHCFNHQTHHRGQVTTLLMQLGRDPGVTDLIAFMRHVDATPPA